MSMYQSPAIQHQQSASSYLSSSLPNRTPLATPATNSPVPAAYPSNTDPQASIRARLRIPPTIEPALLPLAQSTRQSFLQALAADQRDALQPDYQSSFRSANDVVKRLLPYHVWHVNEDDLRWTLKGGKIDRQGSSAAASSPTTKRSLDIEEQIFPTSEEAQTLFDKYSSLQRRAKKLRLELTGGTSGVQGTLFYQESLYNIEKLAVEQERELLSAEHEKLRQAKERAIERGVSWDALMRLGPAFAHGAASSSMGSMAGGSGNAIMPTSVNGFATTSFQKSVGSMYSHNTPVTGRPSPTIYTNTSTTSSLPTTPTNPDSKPRGRPRKMRDKDGKIIATPPVQKPVDQRKPIPSKVGSSVHSNTPVAGSSSSKSAKPTPASGPKPPGSLSSPSTPSQTASPGITIPSHPIPLVLPLSTLARLSSLGIAPVPAPHLLPAISAQQAQRQNSQGQSSTSNLPIPAPVHSTAPRPAPSNQQEPALLMGITEAPLPRRTDAESSPSSPSNGGQPTTQQMLHVSVVLSKLSPSQLSGLAQLMQSLQGTNVAASPSPSRSTTATSTSGHGNSRGR
jgi:hypothetical protein